MAPDQTPRIVRFYHELKRRRVLGSTAAYIVLAALLIELSGAIFDAVLLPDWSTRLVTILLILGLPVVMVLAWFFDLSATGLTRTDTPTSEGPAGGVRGGARGPGQGGTPDLQSALRRAHAVPVPEEPVRRRARRVEADAADGDPVEVDADRVREATLGHVRHELRTPINGIIGYSEMLLEDVDDASLSADLERILAAGRQLLGRVDTVLRPDRLSDDDPELEAFAEQVRVDLRTPINAVVGYTEMLMETCEEEGRPHLLPDLERILTSARRLLEMSEDIVQVATLREDGAAPSALAASSAATRQVLSKIRPGASSEAEGEGRLLVVDDNETNRDLLSRQLARHGYVVATARNGREALDRLEKEDYDLILLDVIMPEMDGLETLRRLQEDDRWAGIPVIMLSSLDEVDSAVRCIELGALDYVSKPVQPTLLEARIAAALEIRELRRREGSYRKRVEADGQLIQRLLTGAVPGPLQARVAEGSLDIIETYPDATVIRCVVAPELRPTAVEADRVRALAGLLTDVEALADTATDICLWRPDGFLAVLGGPNGADGGEAVRAADLVLSARTALGDRVGFGVHTGPAVGGVLGRARVRFEVWGEVVETAESLARMAAPGEVLVAPATEVDLRGSHVLEPRGVREVGGSQMRVHALVSRRPAEADGPVGPGGGADPVPA